MTKRDIFFIVSLACLGIFILIGAYLWRENYVYSKEMDPNKELYNKQIEELQKDEKSAKVSQSSPGKTQPANPVGTTANPPAPPAAANPGNVQNPSANPTPPAAVKSSNNFITPGAKLGDIVKIGEVEMIVTKSTARHKVIDITLKGNTPEQPPRLVFTDNNRIVYEISADVDVNVDITEKTTIDKSPLFYGEQKAGK